MQIEGARQGLPLDTALWQQSRADGVLVALSLLHGAILVLAAIASGSVPGGVLAGAVVAVGVWWGSNTYAHQFIHLPFFRSRALNGLYSLYLSLLLGVPQTFWRERHLAHHAGVLHLFRPSAGLVVELLVALALWAGLLVVAPQFFLTAYVPGFVIGMGLCALQGYFEHSPRTASHYGRLYNALFFNDGYHVEHHARPGCHWTRLPEHRSARAGSPLPPVLRWLEHFSLTGLERLVLRSPWLRARLLASHARAVARLLPRLGAIDRITIVGGGLFPRSVLVLRSLFPSARLRVVDASRRNIETARAFLERMGRADDVEFVHARFEPGGFDAATDLMVIPLSLVGDRDALYARPPARQTLIHDWLWHTRSGASAIVSVWLFKRLNLVEGACRR